MIWAHTHSLTLTEEWGVWPPPDQFIGKHFYVKSNGLQLMSLKDLPQFIPNSVAINLCYSITSILYHRRFAAQALAGAHTWNPLSPGKPKTFCYRKRDNVTVQTL